jgi:UPF0176 protein
MSAVMTFYRFAPLASLSDLKERLQTQADAHGLRGTILIAVEGINGTLSGAKASLSGFREVLEAVDGLRGMPFKFSVADEGNPVFHRLKVRIRPEIVALGRPDVNPAEGSGIHVDAETWNGLLEDHPDLLLIDTRNDYEIAIGTFPGAANPRTRSFKELTGYVEGIDPAAHPRVAMFCTGGIRCEKASAYMLRLGFETVYQLDGGILRYLETVDPAHNRWQGECFVFDQRVSLGRDLAEGSYQQCFACRSPLAPADLESPHYVQGVSCPRCIDELDAGRRASFEERQRQVELAARRGETHVGATMPMKEADERRPVKGGR